MRPESNLCFVEVVGHRNVNAGAGRVELNFHAEVCVPFRLDSQDIIVLFESVDEVL